LLKSDLAASRCGKLGIARSRAALIQHAHVIKLASVSGQCQHHIHSDEHHQNQEPRRKEIREADMLVFTFFF